ncbi:hypothetical protein QTO34_012657 [Cnephaeus nilssonii]|uniref:5-formyltetrahydrofolate cyclo-ligase n=1 Tax=Cnephaeus nilssonii TaxID=3371016 RepID=A0AA40LC50_CNENI|nr:hypothetical protein QTO34_012657 [Eptesicus nilssonii]
MAATAAVSGAKRSLRAELKQRLRTISAEERLRQSRLLAQKVRDRRDGHGGGPGGRPPGRAARVCGSAQAQAQASGARILPPLRSPCARVPQRAFTPTRTRTHVPPARARYLRRTSASPGVPTSHARRAYVPSLWHAHGLWSVSGRSKARGPRGRAAVRMAVMAHSQYQKAQRVSIFLSMHDEIETDEIIKDIFRRGKTCFIPRYQFQSSHMDMVRLASPEEIASLPKTSWNIHQPDEDEAREEALSTGEHAVPGWTS